MNIYTATKYERADILREYNEQIRSLGHRITHDWTVYESSKLADESIDARHMAGMADFAGVMQADLLIYWDHPNANGARWEAGMAAARGIPIWLVEYANPVIFDVLPQVDILRDWEQVFRRLSTKTRTLVWAGSYV